MSAPSSTDLSALPVPDWIEDIWDVTMEGGDVYVSAYVGGVYILRPVDLPYRVYLPQVARNR